MADGKQGFGFRIKPAAAKPEPAPKPAAQAATESAAPAASPPAPEPAQPSEDVGPALAALGLIDQAELERLAAAAGSQENLAALLLRKRLLMPHALGAIGLEAFERVEFNADFVVADPEVLRAADLFKCARKRFLPIARERDVVHVAVSELLGTEEIRDIRAALQGNPKIAPELWPAAELREAFDMAFAGRLTLDAALGNAPSAGVAEIADPVFGEGARRPASRPPFEIRRRLTKSVVADGPRQLWLEDGVRSLNAILAQMITRGASSLRIERDSGALSFRWRVDGAMRQGRALSETAARALAATLEILGAHEHPLQARLGARRVTVEFVRGDAVQGTGALAVRALRTAPASLAALGFTEPASRALKRIASHLHGLVLVAALAGHGKTRTLGALVKLAAPSRKLAGLVARRAELEVPDVPVLCAETDAAMARAIAGLMTEQADVIAIDEPVGPAAWAAAQDAAHAGALVIATVRATDCAAAIARVAAQGVAAEDLALTLQGVHAQVLVPKLCAGCRTPREASAAELRVLGVRGPATIHDAPGCERCVGTGRAGRAAISETMLVDATLAELVARRASRSEMLDVARAAGTIRLAAAAIDAVKEGTVALLDAAQAVDFGAV